MSSATNEISRTAEDRCEHYFVSITLLPLSLATDLLQAFST